MSKFQASLDLFFGYSICALILCGDLISPLADAPIMAPGGSRDFWNLFFIGSFVAAAIVAWPSVTPAVWPEFRPALFMATWMCLAAISAGIYGTWKRTEAIAAFHADKVIQHSFFMSLHQVPRDLQFYIHAAVLKNCVPYSWSYTSLSFYPLDSGVAVNVLPQDWIKECKIKRS
ncbi:hypothetical protein [Rhizobium sp. BT-226]|uniref:hypothetical protein n=1 Tax=Rhizobium sp. BT-226 TaxID=2986922 RepID=UPI0021F6F3BA|nr:hypothetical protein [Rhizobium sp. BT-226]MCW0017455.1 hypothetical protein [Rhizobium sp. BT-226]